MESDEKIRDYLLKRVREEGYPLEIEIAKILEKRNLWSVWNNVYFYDYELGIERTIDIRASEARHIFDKKYEDAKEKIYPFVEHCILAVECKKSSSKACVFFTRPHTAFPFYHGQILDFVQMKSEMKEFCFSEFLNMYGEPCLHYANYKNVAIGYKELEFDKSRRAKKKDSVSLILKASNQLMKFISYSLQSIKEIKSWKVAPFYFYFPLIVFEGKMYEYSQESGKESLSPVNRVLLELWHHPSYRYREVEFAIEIVTKDALEEVLEEIEKDTLTIYKGIKKVKRQLMAKYSKYIP